MWKASLLCRLNAATGQEGSRAVSSRFLAGYLMVVLALGVIGAAGWWLSGHGVVKALQVMISVFVVSCPCALGVAVPLPMTWRLLAWRAWGCLCGRAACGHGCCGCTRWSLTRQAPLPWRTRCWPIPWR
ncbi:hypothetical protein [Verrucomicrobium spinosum]|uniref:P-type ATPase n=1 Tax=Verrucomicrobium spinosum TaxID=2736 RepID=UPI003CCD2766